MTTKPFYRICIEKILSARFLVTIGLTYTFCLITYQTIMLFFANISNKEAIGIIEKIAMFVLGAFCTQFANVVTSYFGRSDRGTYIEDNGNGVK